MTQLMQSSTLSLPSPQGTGQVPESEAAVPHLAGAAEVPGNVNEERSDHQVSGSSPKVLHEDWRMRGLIPRPSFNIGGRSGYETRK